MTNQHTYALPFTREQLQQAYWDQGLSQAEVAASLGTTQKVIWRAMRKWNIPARKAAARNQQGTNNNNWRGNAVSYAAFHKRVEVARGRPHKCQWCETTDPSRTYDWANLNGDYGNLDDYVRLCRSCHWKHDGTINNIPHMREVMSNGADLR
jgi:hypothetical protein